MEIIQKRFDDLSREAESIAKTLTTERERQESWYGDAGQPAERTVEKIDFDAFSVWKNRSESTIDKVFGKDHPHFSNWQTSRELTGPHIQFRELRAIVLAAKSDFEDGFLFDVRRLVHAELFADELEQAEHFLKNGHKVPAAVIAGTVLESTLRELCRQHGVTVEDRNGNDITEKATKDRMSQELAKAGVYNATRAKQIVSWAGIRNDAAHGKPESFDDPQVQGMIGGIRDFVAQQMD